MYYIININSINLLNYLLNYVELLILKGYCCSPYCPLRAVNLSNSRTSLSLLSNAFNGRVYSIVAVGKSIQFTRIEYFFNCFSPGYLNCKCIYFLDKSINFSTLI